MPSLILSSRNTTDSLILRKTAQKLGWETLRLDGQTIPDWFEPPDNHLALFYTPPHAFEIAAQLSRTLLGCNPDWITQVPLNFLLRSVRQTTLAEARTLPGTSFVKHALCKAFPAARYNAASLQAATSRIPLDSLVHVSELVEWTVEYRCFVMDREIVTISPYRRHGEEIRDHSGLPAVPRSEQDAAEEFASSVVKTSVVACPPAFVLDVGFINQRGWAVIEVNESWASGIYACDPARVLDVLLSACVAAITKNEDVLRWDFKQFYSAACPSY